MSNKNDWANVPDPPGVTINGGFWETPLHREDISTSAAVNEFLHEREPHTVPGDDPIMIHEEYSPVVGAVLLNLARAGMLADKHWAVMFLSRADQIRTDYANYESERWPNG
jgi:hypothetical protein